MSYFRAGFLSWWNVVRFVVYFFSIDVLCKTLFSGWRRDSAGNKYQWWERLILGGIIVVLGLIIRLTVIVFGLLVLVCSLALLPLLLIIPIRLSYESLVKIGSIGKSWAYGGASTLHHYGHVLYRGPDKKLYGREDTIEVMTRVLSRDDQDNVLLVGAPGSGRETLVAQFAKNVYRGLVPPKLKNREVIEIHLADTPIDTLQKMFAEAQKAGNIILVLHDLEKYEGVFSYLTPLLSAPELEVIAVTTFEGYHAAWKQRAELMRYFERVEIPPLTNEATLQFLQDVARERYGNVRFEDGALEEIVRRTNELIQQVPQPEKSIDLLENLVANATAVTIQDVHRVLSQQTGVPIGSLERDEKQVLLNLEDALKTEIVGQEEAVHDIAAALRRARTGVGSKEKPIGTFLFLGPTGSGKTHTAKVLAKHYFGGSGAMVRFDMSEFATEETAGTFIERLAVSTEEQPFGLVFFDELEKANRVIWNTLLQVLDEGRLSTRTGRTVSFKNNIIIATSNAGTALIEQHPEVTKNELLQYLIQERLFSPEFLNRFDDTVLFHPLSKEEAVSVVGLMLQDLNARLNQEHSITVQVSETVVAQLVETGFSQQYGARALRRTVQEKIENVVADMILRDQAAPGSVLSIDHI
ncbi:MAG TPA: AAA family ATPase [Candidatus Paceibacterota bacterium]|nr:AAA family ATPase [Candidatus Paceibacterota bacterium]